MNKIRMVTVNDIAIVGDISNSSSYFEGVYTLDTTVNGIHDKSVPALSTGILKYNGTAWIFDNTTYITLASLSATSPILYNNGTGVFSHATTDGNLHVPATGTTNNGKVLTAGSTAGSLSWTTPTTGTVTSVGLSTPSIFTVSGSPITSTGTLGFTFNGSSTNLVRADGSTVASSTYALSSSLGSYLPLAGGTMTGQIISTKVGYQLATAAISLQSIQPVIAFQRTSNAVNSKIWLVDSSNLNTFQIVSGDDAQINYLNGISFYRAPASNILDIKIGHSGGITTINTLGSGLVKSTAGVLANAIAGDVNSQLLTGYTIGANTAVLATDSILGAFGKVQGQINSISTSLGGGPFLPLTAGATKALSGTLYGIGINFTSTTDSPILITHNLAGGFTHPLQAFNSGMVAGNQYNLDFGQAASNYNSGNFGFKYVASGSSANYVTLGLYGANDLLKITGAGVATFSGLGTGVVVGTSGTLSTLTGTNLVRGNGTLTSFVDDGPWLPLAGGVITGPITGTTTTATPFIHITSTFGNLTNAAIRATSTASGGSSIHGIATGTSGVGVWGVSSNTGGDAGLFSGQGGSNGVRAIASGGGKAGLFQGDVLVSGELKIRTSLTGVLKATAGVVAVADSADLPGGPYLPLTGGNITGDLGIINGTLRANSTYTNQGSLYGSAVASPSATNYSVLWVNDGSGTAINGSSSSYMNVAGNTKVWAYDSGVTLSNTLTLSGYPTAGFVKTNGSGVVSIDTTSYLPLTGGNLNSDYFVQGNGGGVLGHRTTNISGATATPTQSGFYDIQYPSDGPQGAVWTHMIRSAHIGNATNNQWMFDIAAAFGGGGHFEGVEGYYVRTISSGSTPGWRQLWHSGNLSASTIPGGPYLPLAGGTMTGSIYSAARSGDGGRWLHFPGGSTGGVSTGTSTALIQRYQYAGFSGFVIGNAEFYGITQDHQYGGPGGQLSLVAGANGGRIAFFAGTPTLQASGSYQAPRVGDWTTTGLAVTGTLSASGSVTAGPAQMSAWSPDGNFARFGHSLYNTGSGFGYIQHSSGTIYLEAPVGTDIHQRINGAEKMTIDSSTTTVYNNLAVSNASVTISGGSLVVNGTWFRDQVGNTIKSCIYMPNLSGGAGANNYSFMAWKDGQFAFINGSSAVGLCVNNADKLVASSSGITINNFAGGGRRTVTSDPNGLLQLAVSTVSGSESSRILYNDSNVYQVATTVGMTYTLPAPYDGGHFVFLLRFGGNNYINVAAYGGSNVIICHGSIQSSFTLYTGLSQVYHCFSDGVYWYIDNGNPL